MGWTLTPYLYNQPSPRLVLAWRFARTIKTTILLAESQSQHAVVVQLRPVLDIFAALPISPRRELAPRRRRQQPSKHQMSSTSTSHRCPHCGKAFPHKGSVSNHEPHCPVKRQQAQAAPRTSHRSVAAAVPQPLSSPPTLSGDSDRQPTQLAGTVHPRSDDADEDQRKRVKFDDDEIEYVDEEDLRLSMASTSSLIPPPSNSAEVCAMVDEDWELMLRTLEVSASVGRHFGR